MFSVDSVNFQKIWALFPRYSVERHIISTANEILPGLSLYFHIRHNEKEKKYIAFGVYFFVFHLKFEENILSRGFLWLRQAQPNNKATDIEIFANVTAQ